MKKFIKQTIELKDFVTDQQDANKLGELFMGVEKTVKELMDKFNAVIELSNDGLTLKIAADEV